jgi:hypothetical protein
VGDKKGSRNESKVKFNQFNGFDPNFDPNTTKYLIYLFENPKKKRKINFIVI